MDVAPDILSVAMVIASLGVVALEMHYLRRVGRRRDLLCVFGLSAAMVGLFASGMGYRRAPSLNPGEWFSGICLGLALCFTALAIWKEGLRRFRDAG